LIVAVKLGTSSLTHDDGTIDDQAIAKACAEVASARASGHQVVVVSSGAIAAGLPSLGLTALDRPKDPVTLQAVSAVGQAKLMAVYDRCFAEFGLIAGQVLVTPNDFMVRSQYLHARATLERLLELGVVPVVNENDAIADDEIRFGDNDRIAALVAQLVGAELLVLLTDTAGALTADPALDAEASLIEEILQIDAELEAVAGGSGTTRGSGGMASKLAAAKIAAWSGVRTVIAAAQRPDVVADAIAGVPGVGTIVQARSSRLSARKVWIAFAVASGGRVSVDAGAKAALQRDASLLAAGVTSCHGQFEADHAVEIVGPDGQVFAKGLTRVSSYDLAAGNDGLVVHRDDLVVLPA